MRNPAKFRADRSNVAEISRLLDFSRWRPPQSCILKFLNFPTVRTVKQVELRYCAKFVEIAQTAAEIWRFFDF